MKERIKSTFKPFEQGQKVWLEGTNIKLGYNKKITTKREGPFVIKKVLGPVNYKLKLPQGWKIHKTFHTSLLTPYTETRTHGENFTRPPPDLIDGEQEWEVERIIAHKGRKNCQYQVKWLGYEELSWETEKDLEHSKELIDDYWRRKHVKSRNPQ